MGEALSERGCFILPEQLIRSEYEWRRKKNCRYSLRAFARTIGISSGLLSEILHGKRNLTPASAKRIAERLRLERSVKLNFISSATCTHGKRRAIRKLPPSSDYHQLDEDTFSLLADWYHFAILNLVQCKGFQPRPEWIANRLGISPESAQQAWHRLLRLGLVRFDSVSRRYHRTKERVCTTSDIQSAALRLSHQQSLEQAIESLHKVPIHLRDISSITMPINSGDLPLIKELIRRFRRHVPRLFESTNANEVYNLNIQLVPVTRCEEEMA